MKNEKGVCSSHTCCKSIVSKKKKTRKSTNTMGKKNKGDTETSGLLSRKKVHFMHAF